MTVLSPTSTWDTIQNVFYRKEEVYQMSWRITDLSDYLVAAAKNGGPIGASLVRRVSHSLSNRFGGPELTHSTDERRAEGDAAWQAFDGQAKDTRVYLVRPAHHIVHGELQRRLYGIEVT
jgi:hypothetical protein